MKNISLRKLSAANEMPAPSRYYAFMDEEFNRNAGGQVGINILIAAAPFALEPEALSGFFSRYDTIRRFQNITLKLFRASLKGDAEPWIADTILSDIPEPLAHAYHRTLKDPHMRVPLFFRTDEVVPGVLSEIQCPGSGWANHEVLHALYDEYPETFGRAEFFPSPLAKSFAVGLRKHVNGQPEVYNLYDNSSLPHGSRYFIQKTRAHGIRYYAWDPDINPRSCNFVRSHDWISLLNNNFHRDHLDACEKGRLFYDLSPMALFDSKVVMALPFEDQTRHHYDDGIRAIFPYTRILTPQGIRSSDGTWLTIATLSKDSSLRRNFYAKYAGTDVNLNWGSRAVYALGNGSNIQAARMFEKFLSYVRNGQPWILQEAHRQKNRVEYVLRNGELQEDKGYLKISGFYGPSGLLGILAYHLRSPKVHGSSRTILSVVR